MEKKTKTWIAGSDKTKGVWISVPFKIYIFFNYFVDEIASLVESLEPAQVEMFAECCFSVV
jgi:hypothetical protein